MVILPLRKMACPLGQLCLLLLLFAQLTVASNTTKVVSDRAGGPTATGVLPAPADKDRAGGPTATGVLPAPADKDQPIKHEETFQTSLPPPRNFPITMDCDCPSDVEILYWVHTRPASYMKRQRIRNTWGNGKHLRYTLGLRSHLRFFVGLADKIETSVLTYEREKYGDIVQAGFKDNYYNLTYKVVSGLNWIVSRCDGENLLAVVKTDDDVAVNMAQLVQLGHKGAAWGNLTNTISCMVEAKAPVNRKSTNKWAVPVSMYADEFYPDYCRGHALLMSPDVPAMLAERATYTPFFWIDDIYFTGMLTVNTTIQLRKMNNVYVYLSANKRQRMRPIRVVIHLGPYYTEQSFPVYWGITMRDRCALDFARQPSQEWMKFSVPVTDSPMVTDSITVETDDRHASSS